MKRALVFPLLFLLTACIDVDMLIDFTGSNEATATAEMRMARDFFEMTGQSVEDGCEDGVGELTETHFICRVEESGSIDEIISGEGSLEMEEGLAVERVGDDQVRVTIDLGEMMGDEDMSGAAEMKEMFAGHSFKFSVRGAEIIESTGEISSDGTTASITVALEDLVDPAVGPGEPFVSLVQLP